MKIPVDKWSYEDEERYKKLLTDKALGKPIPPNEQKWLNDHDWKRTELIDARTKRISGKPVDQRLHYKWIEFYRDTMIDATAHELAGRNKRAAWLILLETELLALEQWNPALTRWHTLRRHGFLALRAEYVMLARYSKDSKEIELNKKIDLSSYPKEQQKWELLWKEEKNRCAEIFPILSPDEVQGFREKVIKETYELTYYCYPAFPKGYLQKRNPSETD